jgi:hypothetical protein
MPEISDYPHSPLPQNSSSLLRLLREGQMTEVHGLLPWSSNYTFLVSIHSDAASILAIYKPKRGEQPLWDFPDGTLYHRETAAYLVSDALTWNLVPPTIVRDGIHGIGSVQLHIQHDASQNYFTFGADLVPQLKKLALFDVLINNADRKGGHCLLDANGKIWGIDHGICFHRQPKLRTVIWDFSGDTIPDEWIGDIFRFRNLLNEAKFAAPIREFLSASEVDALKRRASDLIECREFPPAGSGRNYPWPPV